MKTILSGVSVRSQITLVSNPPVCLMTANRTRALASAIDVLVSTSRLHNVALKNDVPLLSSFVSIRFLIAQVSGSAASLCICRQPTNRAKPPILTLAIPHFHFVRRVDELQTGSPAPEMWQENTLLNLRTLSKLAARAAETAYSSSSSS